MLKEMGLIEEAADHAGIDLAETNAVRKTLERAMEDGAADLDFSAVIATILGETAAG
jgi:3-hydroxyisobutyrate dehydrogenase-like beta-hydroxyacid dehydrogenase